MKKITTIVIILIISTSASGLNIKNITTINDELSQFWGCKNLKLTNGTGFFDTYQDDNETWWFVDPEGYAFYSVGVCAVNPNIRYIYNISIIDKYGNYENWANATVKRFKDWGFNTLGAWSEYNLFSNIPYTHTFISRRDPRWNIARNHPDVFDPYWQSSMKSQIENFTQSLKNDPYLVGYWLDNEMNWGPDSFDTYTLLEEYMTPTYEYIRPGKIVAVKFLKERYQGDVDEFNSVWNMDIISFDELYDICKLGRDGYIEQHRIERIKGDIKAFNELVAETYFNITTSLIRENDPNHLILGVRFHLEGVSEEIIKICGKYSDIVSINYYRKRIIMYDPLINFRCIKWGSVPLNNWVVNYYNLSKKPLLIGEFSCKSLDSGLPFNLAGACRTVITQKSRARYFKWYANKCLETSYIVGYHWFAYVDKIESEVDKNLGLVNKYDDNYTFVKYLLDINSKVYDMH